MSLEQLIASGMLIGLANVIKLSLTNVPSALRSIDLSGVFADTSLDTAQYVIPSCFHHFVSQCSKF
jgi:hypothetical protein